MFEAFGDNSERQGLDSSDSLVAVGAVGHYAAQCRYFGQPAAVVLAIKFDRENHNRYCSIGANCLTSEWSRRADRAELRLLGARLIRRR